MAACAKYSEGSEKEKTEKPEREGYYKGRRDEARTDGSLEQAGCPRSGMTFHRFCIPNILLMTRCEGCERERGIKDDGNI